MLRITAVGAGAVDYLLRGSGCTDHEHAHQLDAGLDAGLEPGREHAAEQTPEPGRRGQRGAARYFGSAVEHGEPAGRWGGRGLAGMFGVAGIEIGTVASEDVVRAVFGRLQDPTSGGSLGRAPRTFKDTAERVEAALAAAGPEATPEQRRAAEVAAASDGRRAVAYYD